MAASRSITPKLLPSLSITVTRILAMALLIISWCFFELLICAPYKSQENKRNYRLIMLQLQALTTQRIREKTNDTQAHFPLSRKCRCTKTQVQKTSPKPNDRTTRKIQQKYDINSSAYSLMSDLPQSNHHGIAKALAANNETLSPHTFAPTISPPNQHNAPRNNPPGMHE
jgi:hypothetical protein